MNLFIYTGASRLNAAVVESATDLTPVSRLPDLIVGDSEPVTVKFLSASGAYESWSGGGTYTLSISIGALGGDGIAAYFQTSSFTTVTNGWTGRLNLASGSLPSVVSGYLAERPGAQSVPLFVQVRVTDASGYTETYARQAVSISGAVSVPTTANSTPVTYATAADVAANASTASAAAIAAAASASAAAGSASTAAGHVTTAGNSATAAAASAVTAGNSATTASGHATTATTQATNAATSASSASAYKDAAAVSAASATSSAGTATTQAALATTNGAAQVTLAAAQVTLATTQATNAGTSASAAAVSAAAALVSEAAALVSKNAAAASAATASAVSGSGNGTFSAAALTGVNSITASASTALTLTGGSTGASLVLGATTSGQVTFTKASGDVQYKATSGTKIAFFGTDSANPYVGAISNDNLDIWAGAANKARLTSTGNLLIGTTNDSGARQVNAIADSSTTFAANFTQVGLSLVNTNTTANNWLNIQYSDDGGTPSGIIGHQITDHTNKYGLFRFGVRGTGGFVSPLVISPETTASSTTTGALRVTGGVGVSGAGYFGGALNAPSLTGAASTDLALNGGSGTSNVVLTASGAGGNVYARPGASGYVRVDTGLGMRVESGTLNVTTTTSASSSTVGALTIGNGTAATNVAIGGGNVNAGGNLTALGTASIGGAAVSDPLVVQGGGGGNIIFRLKADQAFYLSSQTVDPATAGATLKNSVANYFRGGYWNGSASVQTDALIQHVITSTTPTSKLTFQVPAGTEIMSLASSGAATFAGAAITASATFSGAGAIPITTSLVKFTSTGAAQALTLANGVDGQRLTIVHDVKGTLGTGVLTPTTKTGFSTVTFTNAGDTVSLVYVATRGWMVTGSYLATIVP